MKRYGSKIDPPNRFDRLSRELDFEHLEWDEEYLQSLANRKIVYLEDTSRSIISENDSPDIPFRYSLNPYRGCSHGCAYCYARNSHEYLDMNAGLDFETRIVVKRQAADLFQDFLAEDKWKPEPIAFSGITDCYQPAERHFRLTRQCLEVACQCRQPVTIITKNALVLRDIDLLAELARNKLVHVFLSVTSLDRELARTMEPRTSAPHARLRAVKTLTEAGIPTGVMVAPVIPGLNDSEIPTILQSAAEAGAQAARYILLRLPITVKPVFCEWLERTQPLKKDRVESRIRQTRHGQMNNSQWGERMRGAGPLADQISTMFQVFAQKFSLVRKLPALNTACFVRPPSSSGQQWLF